MLSRLAFFRHIGRGLCEDRLAGFLCGGAPPSKDREVYVIYEGGDFTNPRPLFCFVAVFIYIPSSAGLSCTPAFVGAGPGRSSAVAGTLPALYPSRLPNCISTIRVLKHREPLLRGVFVFQERDKFQRTMAFGRRWSVNGAFFMEYVWCHAFAVS